MCTTLSIVKVFGIDHSWEVLNVILKIKSGLLLITATKALWSMIFPVYPDVVAILPKREIFN